MRTRIIALAALLCPLSGCRMMDWAAAAADKRGEFKIGMTPTEVAQVLDHPAPEKRDFKVIHNADGDLAYWVPTPIWGRPWFFAFRADTLTAWGPAPMPGDPGINTMPAIISTWGAWPVR